MRDLGRHISSLVQAASVVSGVQCSNCLVLEDRCVILKLSPNRDRIIKAFKMIYIQPTLHKLIVYLIVIMQLQIKCRGIEHPVPFTPSR